MGAWETAQAQVALKYDPQQAALDRQLASSKAGTVANEGAIQGFGGTGRDIIGSTYNTLYGLLGNNQQMSQQQLGQQAQLGDNAYDQALSQLGAQKAASRSYLEDMYKSLGQTDYQMPKFGEAEDIAQTMNARAVQAKTAYGGNFRDWMSKMNSIDTEGINSAHQAEALRKTEFESQLMKMLGENRLAGTTQETELQGKLADILGMRGNDLIAMYNELAQQEWERQMAQAQLDSENNRSAAQIASSERIAGMQESGANQRAAAANKQASDLEMQKFLYGISKDEQDRLDSLNQAGFGNQLDLDKLSLERQKLGQGNTDYGAMTGTLLQQWPLAFLDDKGNFDVPKYTNMYTTGRYGNTPLTDPAAATQMKADAARAQVEKQGREQAAKPKSSGSGSSGFGHYFDFGSLLRH
jgi:hypothetical protein